MEDKWGEWIASKCTRYFETPNDAEQYLRDHNYTGKVLQTPEGIMAVCCAYPDGYYPEAETLIDICDEPFIDHSSSSDSGSCCEPAAKCC
ncbi:MAG: hypothetical protein CMA61_04995 [Euryarchaeota archaeon]|jgi:hypothetical protein|nr:hypothetical protein [Euryarchaeota archaeon]HIK99419.1 hypothetical protein [Candidatus Poseidoniales archaeon]|tara:strand:- start:7867 stop:8136 length:270 start_codon:yes stop_codon:yes gene_type:complete